MTPSLRLRVLTLLVDVPHELDAAAIAAHLFPPPKLQPRSHP